MSRRHPFPSLLIATLLVLPLLACDGGEAGGEVVADSADAVELGEMGARIYLEPERAEAILEEADLDRETFAARVREVSADPERARAYADAFERVAGEEAPDDTGGVEPAAEQRPGDAGAGADESTD